MKRRVLRVIVFLLLGAIVNVAVAWGCVVCSAIVPSDDLYVPDESLNQMLKRVPAPWILHGDISWRIKSFGMSFDSVYCYLSPNPEMPKSRSELPTIAGGPLIPPAAFAHQQSGWPLLSLQGWQLGGMETTPSKQWAQTSLAGYRLPIGFVWPGFAINTIFYAAVLWVMFVMPFALRRRLRIRRGLCPACAYPIGSSPVCTECGVNLPLPREGEGWGEGA